MLKKRSKTKHRLNRIQAIGFVFGPERRMVDWQNGMVWESQKAVKVALNLNTTNQLLPVVSTIFI